MILAIVSAGVSSAVDPKDGLRPLSSEGDAP